MAACVRRLCLQQPQALCQAGRRFVSAESAAGEFLYTPEHWQLRQTVKRVVDTEINPFVDEWEANGQFPAQELFKKLGDVGVFGIDKPTEYGGLGLDFSYCVAVAEELGTVDCGGVPMGIGVQANMATPALARFGSEYVKREFLAPTIAGDVVACLGVSEVTAGSDVAGVRTQAVRQGAEYVINGGKMWTTNGAQADWMCLLANTSKEGGPHRNKSLICLPMDSPGVSKSKKLDKLGMRSSDTVQVFFEDVKVPTKNLIGQEGQGFTYQMLQFQDERLIGTALALCGLEKCVQQTKDYAASRKLFAGALLDQQTVHFKLAELQTEIEALRSLLYRATYQRMRNQDATLLASMAKLKCGRLCRQVTDECLQFWGGMGFMNESLITRFYRDFRLMSIGAGADEVMLSIICKFMNTLPK